MYLTWFVEVLLNMIIFIGHPKYNKRTLIRKTHINKNFRSYRIMIKHRLLLHNKLHFYLFLITYTIIQIRKTIKTILFIGWTICLLELDPSSAKSSSPSYFSSRIFNKRSTKIYKLVYIYSSLTVSIDKMLNHFAK